MFNWDVKILSMGNIVYPERQGGLYIWTGREGDIYNLFSQLCIVQLSKVCKTIVPRLQYSTINADMYRGHISTWLLGFLPYVSTKQKYPPSRIVGLYSRLKGVQLLCQNEVGS